MASTRASTNSQQWQQSVLFLIFIFLMPGFTVSNSAWKYTKGRECGCSRLFFGGRVNMREGPKAGSDRGGENFSPFDHATINTLKMLSYSYKCFFTISSKTLTPGFQIPHPKLESKVPEYGFANSHVVTGFPTAAPEADMTLSSTLPLSLSSHDGLSRACKSSHSANLLTRH